MRQHEIIELQQLAAQVAAAVCNALGVQEHRDEVIKRIARRLEPEFQRLYERAWQQGHDVTMTAELLLDGQRPLNMKF